MDRRDKEVTAIKQVLGKGLLNVISNPQNLSAEQVTKMEKELGEKLISIIQQEKENISMDVSCD